jgi:hypothetical protein
VKWLYLHWSHVFGYRIDWGSVPVAIGSVLTGTSLLLAFHILLQDRRKEEREQARQVACWAEYVNLYHHLGKPDRRVSVYNWSSGPIYRACLIVTRGTRSWENWGFCNRWQKTIFPLRPGDDMVSRLLPGEHASVRIPYDVIYGVHERWGTLVTVYLIFIDAFGRDWTKQVSKYNWERTGLTAGVIYGNDCETKFLIPVPLNREGYTRPRHTKQR